jgi:hypothetical protein
MTISPSKERKQVYGIQENASKEKSLLFHHEQY